MPKLTRSIFFILCVLGSVLYPHDLFAQSLKSKYFDIEIREGVDKFDLIKRLKINYFLHLDTATSKTSSDVDDQIKDAVDAIYLEVCDVLDIRMPSFRIGLEIVPGKNAISETVGPYYKEKIDVPSFYRYDNNTIYISSADLTAGMLAHEMSHAVISHYFVVPPPVKVQEVLSGYAEYSIRKLTKEKLK